MKASIKHHIGQDALALGLVTLLVLAALSHIAEPGMAKNAALMALVFLIPSLASAGHQFYRDLSDHHFGH